MDKENFTLEELLDEDEIIQECKALNSRLINFLRERAQVQQLLRYIVEEAPEDAEKRRTFKFPFIACEIFTCEVDIILKALVEDEEVLIRLIGADEHLYSNYTDSMQWVEDTDVLEMIVDKYSSSDCPEVHANTAETLCAITRYAPPGLAAKITSPSFIGRLFCHALEDSRPKSVLVNSLSVCISLLDPKRLTLGTYHFYSRQLSHGSTISANPETVEGMLGEPRYPFNNFLHHHVEHIIMSCLESKNSSFIEHLLHDCNLVGRILEAEKNITLAADPNKPAIPTEGKPPPRIGNIGHITRISNKLVQLGNNNSDMQAYLQENSEWVDWHTNVLVKRNAVENVHQWACGRPTALHDRTRDSDDDDYQDRDYDVAALANNLSQAFRYGIYGNDDMEEVLAHGSHERDDEDVYFDDESAEVVISSLRLGDDQDSGSLFTNSNWFAFEDDRIVNERSADSIASPSPNTEGTGVVDGCGDEVNVDKDENLTSTTSQVPEPEVGSETTLGNLSEESSETGTKESDKPPEWVEWRETSDSVEPSDTDKPSVLPNGELQVESENRTDDIDPNTANPSPSSDDASVSKTNAGGSPESTDNSRSKASQPPPESGDENPSSKNPSASTDVDKPVGTQGSAEKKVELGN
ncbi:hypothetical protein HYC85_018920 [Camellia sinensis]|uniref:Uncharacterized protein n=1 Tax=Camellia sinensis TaxID=4442 RepID=A0A7J7GVN2_CAMSI|nr:hypothetical protein HYC85_018920 [Camellia sinensis]